MLGCIRPRRNGRVVIGGTDRATAAASEQARWIVHAARPRRSASSRSGEASPFCAASRGWCVHRERTPRQSFWRARSIYSKETEIRGCREKIEAEKRARTAEEEPEDRETSPRIEDGRIQRRRESAFSTAARMSGSQRRQMMQQWPLCLVPVSRTKVRHNTLCYLSRNT